VLDASIIDAFKVSTDPTIRGWHAGMSVQDIFSTNYRAFMASHHQQPWKLMALPFAVCIRQQMLPRCYFGELRIARKMQYSVEIHTPTVNFYKMQYASSSQRGCMSGRSKNGID